MHLSFKKSGLLLVSSLMLLASCASGSPTYHKGEKVFVYDKNANVVVTYDLSANEKGYNINIQFGDYSKIEAVQIGREEASKSEYGYKNGILTLSGKLLNRVASGEKTINVTPAGERAIKIPALFCDKIISTAQDFQDINNNLDGTYCLANDIDFASFGNFEPLGRYVSETDTTNHYFHGILEGNGYALKNMQVIYSQNPTQSDGTNTLDSNRDAYDGTFGFKDVAHKNGDNIGVFQIIGSSGVVRNLVFDNVKVLGRTIVGVVAGNVAGTVENVLIKENCSAKMNTHFYDNDCNVGGAFGIVGGSGQVRNVVSLTQNISVSALYQDYGPDYAGKTGNGWDHSAQAGNTDNWWRFAGVNRDIAGTKNKELDSNGKNSNGVYSVVGKCWGSVSNSLGVKFTITPKDGTSREICFGQTHLGSLKPTSGDSDLGQFNNCAVYGLSELSAASLYSGFDTSVWNITDGSLPTLKAPIVRTGTIQ